MLIRCISDENKVIRIAKCDVFSGVCESIRQFSAFRCESLVRGNVRVIFISMPFVEFYLYPTVGTVLIHSVKPELTE